MSVKNIVILDKDSEFKGEIITGQLILEGRVEGAVKASDRVVLREGATLEGDVTAGNFTMAEGANFRGELLVRRDENIFNEKKSENPFAEPDEEPTKPVNITRLQAEQV